MHFSSNYKGGAIYCVNSNLNLYNVKFQPFTTSDEEDYTVSRYNPYTAYYGGSIYSENSNLFIDRSSFDDSISFSFGGCIASLNSDITVRESNFNNSLSLTDGGGAIYNSNSQLYIYDSTFQSNGAEFGGAICNLNSILYSFHTRYYSNYANRYGGAIYDIYGTLNFYTNWFSGSHALIGGTVYTRIPNDFIMHYNTFSGNYANDGSSIFYDGKKQNVISNVYTNHYHVFAEFSAKLNGEDYYIISNPLYYTLSSSPVDYLPFSYSVYEVYDDLVNMVIYGADDANLTSIATDEVINNISINIKFSDEFVNPSLKVYLLEGTNLGLYNNWGRGNVYTGSRDKLFESYNLIKEYSIGLSDNNGTLHCTLDFSNSFLSIKYDNIYEAMSFNSVPLINNSFFDLSSLPSEMAILLPYYNSNDYGFVSSVKDQKDGGNCWAFSGISTLETCLNKATGLLYDFSEENAKNLMAAYSVYGVRLETNHAGYEAMLLSYLTSWLGPIDESLENYDDYSSISVLENPMFHIQNVKFLPARLNSLDNDLYKMAIMDNGAVSVTFKWGKGFHSVSIVGWDDNYNGKDSLGNDANGAWIFKNSWGSDWGNNGFGYLSYDQKISEQIYPNLHAYTFVFNDNVPYTKIYQYDFAGVSEFYHYMDTIYFKNAFTADTDSLLSAFSTYFDTQTNFTVMVYKNNQFMFAQNGTSSAGYFTIPFNTIVQLDKGDEFSIVVNNHNKGYNCIPVCSAEEITKKTFSQNVSFISLDGENWFDLYDYADSCNVACIKAFTQNINLTDIIISIDEFSSVNTKNLNIKVSFGNVDVNAINYCLVKFIIDGEIYYAQIKNGEALLNVNLKEGNHTLSAQYKDNVFESNIVQFNFTVDLNVSSQSFNAIQDLINDAEYGTTIDLNKDYFYDEQFDDGRYGVNIDKTLVINGNGHVVDGLFKSTGFYIGADNVVLENIIFKNTVSSNGGGVYIAGCNVTLNNCSFINSTATQNGGGIYSLFDITLNNCKFINDSANQGGGLYLMSNHIVYIKDSYFNNNSALVHGSAAYLEGIGECLISSTNFTNNIAKFNGGAVFSVVNGISFTKCLFENNSANSGGAIFSNANSNNFTECLFLNNSVKILGGAISAHNKINVYCSDFINNDVTQISDILSPFGGLGGGAIYSFDDLNIYNSNFIANNAECGGALSTVKYLKIYKSNFINNSASRQGGAIYTNDWQMFKINWSIHLFSEALIYDSYFEDNHAQYGGAIQTAKLVNNCTFINNHVDVSGGAIYGVGSVVDSKFINNSACYGGAVYDVDNVVGSKFINNSANDGGAIYDGNSYEYIIKNNLIINSSFINNSADYGGAILLISTDKDNSTILLCNFTGNHVKLSGGAIYSVKKCLVEKTNFVNNSASYGGAIIFFNDDENATCGMEVISCYFANNSVNARGGAIYSDGICFIQYSNFANNSALYGTTLYSSAFLDLRNSNIESSVDVPSVEFIYHYIDNSTFYGELYLKNNKFDVKGIAVYYNENAVQYKLPLNLVFNKVMIIKGQYVQVCHLEDEDGNVFSAFGTSDLNAVLTNQNDEKIKIRLEFDMKLGGFYLNTSSLDYGVYNLDGALYENYPGNYVVKQGILSVVDESGKMASVLLAPAVTKVYGSNKQLLISLVDGFGNPISYNFVSVNLNGRILTLITDENGRVALPLDLAPKTYYVHVSFEGNHIYFASDRVVKVVIKKIKPVLTAKKKITFKFKSKNKKYEIKLKNTFGKAIKNAKIRLKINKKIYVVKTNNKGKAVFKLKFKKKGKFKGTIKYAGSAYYGAVTKKVKIIVKK